MSSGSRVGGLSVEPGWLWRTWWIWTEPSRLLIRLFAESVGRRRLSFRLWLSALRLAGHVMVGNPWWVLGLVVVGFTGLTLRPVLVLLVLFELGLVVAKLVRGRPLLISAYRLGIKVHRIWPRTYADTAAKSERIQDREAGNSGESRAPVARSVVDHPRLPWRFWVRWPVITFRVGVAPGRSFTQLERVMAQMSANIPWIHAVELEYRTDRSSFGLLHVSVHDVLERSRRPGWTPTNQRGGSGLLGRLGGLLNRSAPPPRLRLVRDDEGEAA